MGRKFADVPYIARRVCGICSASHVITDILAIERIFGVEVTDRTRALRELLVYGSLPAEPRFAPVRVRCARLPGHGKRVPAGQGRPRAVRPGAGPEGARATSCATLVGGRSIHPITAVVGGFTHEPSADEYLALADKMDVEREFARAAVDLFDGFTVPDIATTRATCWPWWADDHYPVCPTAAGRASWTRASRSMPNDCASRSRSMRCRIPRRCSPAAGRRGRPTSPARWRASTHRGARLSQDAKVAAAKAGLRPPERNPFLNNVAQAVEVVDALGRCADLCRKLAEPDGPFEGCSAPVPLRGARGRAARASPRRRAARCSTSSSSTTPAAWCTPPS